MRWEVMLSSLMTVGAITGGQGSLSVGTMGIVAGSLGGAIIALAVAIAVGFVGLAKYRRYRDTQALNETLSAVRL